MISCFSKSAILAGAAVIAMPCFAQDDYSPPPNMTRPHTMPMQRYQPPYGQGAPIRVVVNGQPIYFRYVQPEEVNGRILVPLRGVFEGIGAYVHWNASTQTVRVERGNGTVTVQIGNHRAFVDGREVNLDVPPILVADNTLVPLRFISESLGADVDWRPAQSTVVISTVREPRRVANQETQRPPMPPPPPPERPVIESNMRLMVTLNRTLSSRDAMPGDRFEAMVTGRRGYDFFGAHIHGVIVDAKRAIEGAPGVLQIRLNRMVLPDGTEIPISGEIVGPEGARFVAVENGIVMADRQWFRHQMNHDVFIPAGTPIQVSISPRNGGEPLDEQVPMRRGGPYNYNYGRPRGGY